VVESRGAGITFTIGPIRCARSSARADLTQLDCRGRGGSEGGSDGGTVVAGPTRSPYMSASVTVSKFKSMSHALRPKIGLDFSVREDHFAVCAGNEGRSLCDSTSVSFVETQPMRGK
jgi:hypothetical protein